VTFAEYLAFALVATDGGVDEAPPISPCFRIGRRHSGSSRDKAMQASSNAQVCCRPAIADALAAALEHQFAIAWPTFLDGLVATQAEFLAAKNSRPPSSKSLAPQPQQISARPGLLLNMLEQLKSGAVNASGGGALSCAATERCNGVAERLGTVLDALASAPLATVDRVNRQWVPLALAFMGPVGSGQQARASASAALAAAATSSAAASDTDVESADSNGVAEDGKLASHHTDTKLAGQGHKRGRGGGGRGVSRGSVGSKDWRSALRLWLSIICRQKDAGNYHRCSLFCSLSSRPCVWGAFSFGSSLRLLRNDAVRTSVTQCAQQSIPLLQQTRG
jgi:hypothetical protein